jgi:hypothetical protein
MTDEQQIARGRRALREFEELSDVFDRLERNTVERLKMAAIGQDALVVKLHMQLHTLAGIKTAMREMIDNGRIAEAAVAVAGLNRPD